MATWNTRLQERMKELHITQEELADQLGITRGAITHYLADRRQPSMKQMKRLAVALKCDPAWLQFGVVGQASKMDEKLKVPNRDVPILEWTAVKDFSMPERAFDAKTLSVPCFCHQTGKSRLFALRVKGDAMVAPTGHARSFHEGDILIADPDKDATHGSYVIVMLPGSQEATFKQYVVDGGTRYLKPLNPQYPMVQIGKDAQICGVVTMSASTLA